MIATVLVAGLLNIACGSKEGGTILTTENAAVATVTIQGKLGVGQSLTARAAVPINGVTEILEAKSLKWYVLDGKTQKLSDALHSVKQETYTVQETDLGKYIVVVAETENYGNIQSRAYGPVTVDGDAGDGGLGYTIANPDSTNLAIKFGILSSSSPANPLEVTSTFNAIHSYISDSGQFNKTTKDTSGAIKLGDYIDMLHLVVEGDGDGGERKPGDSYGTINKTDVRLIVVGINSFNGINGNDKAHVVFHFRDIPGRHKMNSTKTNETGYLDSAMRTYLINNFLPGLKNAGVPDSVLWAPERIVASMKGGTPGAETIADKLWLPTEFEMFGYSYFFNDIEGNQANFTGYYKNDDMRIKKLDSGDESGFSYYVASAAKYDEVENFSIVFEDGSNVALPAFMGYGCVPAFCVW